MSKQGAMVFYVDVGNMPAAAATDYVIKLKNEFVDNDSMGELRANYDLLWMAGNRTDGVGTRIEVFPYKDYVFNIKNMTASEIEIFTEQEVINKLQRE